MEPLLYKPDAPAAMNRIEAWWYREILDRPCLQVAAPKPNPRPLPEKSHVSLRDRWMDSEFVVERADGILANTWWGGEILPAFWPNLGPDVLAALFGAELEFGEDTSWSKPLLLDWSDMDSLCIRDDTEYLKTLLSMTDLALEIGRGRFLVGLTDLHPGGDLAAALRGPQQLCLDIALEPERVHQLLRQTNNAFFVAYEVFRSRLMAAGQSVTTSWLPVYAEGRAYIPSNDFSCMISNAVFRDFFLEELLAEIQWLDRSIYHLDGPQALHHLDILLETPGLHAIQWVWGAGKGTALDWIEVFRRIQAGGKGLWIPVAPEEIDPLMEALRPEGVLLYTSACSVEEGEALLSKVTKWR